MTLLQTRGGIPDVFRDTIDATGRKHQVPFFFNFIVARNKGVATVRLYFAQDDFDADANFVELIGPAAASPFGEWLGPVEGDNYFLRTESGTASVEIVVFQRRG